MLVLVCFWELTAGRDARERTHGCTLRAPCIPPPGALDSEQGACVFFRELQKPYKCSPKENPKAPMMFLLFPSGLSPANDSGAKKKKKKPKRKKEKGDQPDQAQDQPVKVIDPFLESQPCTTVSPILNGSSVA